MWDDIYTKLDKFYQNIESLTSINWSIEEFREKYQEKVDRLPTPKPDLKKVISELRKEGSKDDSSVEIIRIGPITFDHHIYFIQDFADHSWTHGGLNSAKGRVFCHLLGYEGETFTEKEIKRVSGWRNPRLNSSGLRNQIRQYNESRLDAPTEVLEKMPVIEFLSPIKGFNGYRIRVI